MLLLWVPLRTICLRGCGRNLVVLPVLCHLLLPLLPGPTLLYLRWLPCCLGLLWQHLLCLWLGLLRPRRLLLLLLQLRLLLGPGRLRTCIAGCCRLLGLGLLCMSKQCLLQGCQQLAVDPYAWLRAFRSCPSWGRVVLPLSRAVHAFRLRNDQRLARSRLTHLVRSLSSHRLVHL